MCASYPPVSRLVSHTHTRARRQSFTCDELYDALVNIHRGGVKVRVVSCSTTVHSSGSDILRLKAAKVDTPRHSLTRSLARSLAE